MSATMRDDAYGEMRDDAYGDNADDAYGDDARRRAMSEHSGFGREGGTEGIEEYLDTKYVAIDM
jgi:hypothetical protein